MSTPPKKVKIYRYRGKIYINKKACYVRATIDALGALIACFGGAAAIMVCLGMIAAGIEF